MKHLINMEHIAHFSTMEAERMKLVNGGGFAYDVGRGIRFLAFYTAYGIVYAMADSIANDMLNEAENS